MNKKDSYPSLILEVDKFIHQGSESTKMMLQLFLKHFEHAYQRNFSQTNCSNVVIYECTTQGNTAQCNLTANGKNETIDLIKQDGKRLVDFKKEQTNPIGPGK